MDNEIIVRLKDVFDSIVCLAVEGPEVCSKAKLLEAIKKDALRGYALCNHYLEKPRP